MAKLNMDILMSDRTARAIALYKLNVPEIACLALRDEILRRQEVDNTIDQVSPTGQVNSLRLQLYQAREEITRLKGMGYDQTAALKVMVRS